MYYMFLTRKQKKDKELSKDMFRVFQHKLSCHVSSVIFIFDQSSAHTSLFPDALHAFEMIKSDSGKQQKQHDTIIPMTNPDPLFHGSLQSSTGLCYTTTECYAFVPQITFAIFSILSWNKFHLELLYIFSPHIKFCGHRMSIEYAVICSKLGT